MIHVTVDISPIVYERGVSRYTANLVRALARQSHCNTAVFGTSSRQMPALQHFARTVPRLTAANLYQIPPTVVTAAWYGVAFPPIEWFIPRETQVFHAWEELVPPSGVPVVATIHDLAMLRYPQTAHPQTLSKHQSAWQRLRSQRAHIIAVSQSTKADVVELLGFPDDHVHVVYEALPEESRLDLSPQHLQRVTDQFEIRKPFFFCVGTREPRKNLQRIVAAWQPLAGDFDLIIAGASGWDEFDSKRFTHLPKLLGRVSSVELACLYQRADVFIYASLYEGFGLPILEAFHYHTPVVTGAVSSMMEVAGNAAQLVDPLSVESITEGIQAVVNSTPMQRERRLQQMKVRSQLFSWEYAADQTIRVYQKAVQERS